MGLDFLLTYHFTSPLFKNTAGHTQFNFTFECMLHMKMMGTGIDDQNIFCNI